MTFYQRVVQKKKVFRYSVIFNILPLWGYQVNKLHPVKREIIAQIELVLKCNPFFFISRVMKQFSNII